MMRLKKRQIFFLLLLIAGTVYVARTNRKAETEAGPQDTRRFTERIFGTVMNVTYTSGEDLHDTIMICLRQVDASLSMFNPNSTISRINRNETDSLDHHLLSILPMALEISAATDGAFDISVAPLVNAWGFGFKNDKLPDGAQVDSLRALVDHTAITIADGHINKRIPGMVIDLSAIAKGYGTDQVAKLLCERGVSDFMVEIGGEIVCKGNNPKGEAWRVGINSPVESDGQNTNEVHDVICMHDRAMATSGNYRNYYIDANGRKLSHTIDPKTGYPVRHTLLSSTVTAPTCAMADAYATAFMVMGLDKAREIVTANPQLQAYLIYSGDNGFCTWSNIEENQQKTE